MVSMALHCCQQLKAGTGTAWACDHDKQRVRNRHTNDAHLTSLFCVKGIDHVNVKIPL